MRRTSSTNAFGARQVSDGKLFAGIYVDADLLPGIAIALRQRNYASQSAVEDGFREASDEQILERAVELGMVLLTNNARHFVTLAQQWTRQGREHSGILSVSSFGAQSLATCCDCCYAFWMV